MQNCSINKKHIEWYSAAAPTLCCGVAVLTKGAYAPLLLCARGILSHLVHSVHCDHLPLLVYIFMVLHLLLHLLFSLLLSNPLLSWANHVGEFWKVLVSQWHGSRELQRIGGSMRNGLSIYLPPIVVGRMHLVYCGWNFGWRMQPRFRVRGKMGREQL
jgi:hypothetical protein